MNGSFLVGKRLLLSTVIAGIVCLGSLVWAQGTAYLTGYVLDPSDAGVPNATVEIRNNTTGTTVSLKSTDAGIYHSPALDPGVYTITVTANGFQTSVTNEIAVEVGQPRGVDIHLSVGQQQQKVEVTASAPLLKTEDSGLGQSVDFSQVSKLPYLSRSAGALLGLSPGVRYGGEDSISYGASRYSVAGWTN